MTEFSFARKPAVGTWITTSDVKVLDQFARLRFLISSSLMRTCTCSSTSLLELIRVCQFHGVLQFIVPHTFCSYMPLTRLCWFTSP